MYVSGNLEDSKGISRILACASLLSFLEMFAVGLCSSQWVLDTPLYKTGRCECPVSGEDQSEMSLSLSGIETKLDELVKMQREKTASKDSTEKNRKQTDGKKEQTQEEKDAIRLREIDSKITDLVDLLHTGVTRESADVKVDEHRARVNAVKAKGEPRTLQKVFHDHGGKRIATTTRTQVCTNSLLVCFYNTP